MARAEADAKVLNHQTDSLAGLRQRHLRGLGLAVSKYVVERFLRHAKQGSLEHRLQPPEIRWVAEANLRGLQSVFVDQVFDRGTSPCSSMIGGRRPLIMRRASSMASRNSLSGRSSLSATGSTPVESAPRPSRCISAAITSCRKPSWIS